ncbi:RluA family pseudouridine synthase [Roseburia rectibacter]|jgi:23S rRNA pseudouridine955/2504/2580 synthase|uniref:RluA family pseudouridine synthase n=1 Tax=Roseburia rectibacter TaxID=2763062 RepID=UPI00164BECAB|nr:RluA family pseudouridine synthase [Roseburia rectibacter]UMY98712.1 RluA family pseudouridine synthase [Roseburia rectibacter]
MREFKINDNEAGQRFDKYLKKLLGNAPGSFIYKMLRKKNITLNGKKADGTEKLNKDDDVKLFFSDETFEKFSGSTTSNPEYEALNVLSKEFTSGKRKLQVVYEDKDIIFINKPTGMLSQKAKPEDISANEYILAYLIAKGELTESSFRTFRPSICNRLDRNTSGLLAAGKTLKGLQNMAKALKERTVQKYYRCIVRGTVKESSYLKGYLQKDETENQVLIRKTKPSVGEWLPIETEYRPIRCRGGYTELEVHLMTGRSHQIRAHLASTGHPIIGDYKYGNSDVNAYFKKNANITSQLLHASRFVFEDGKEITAPCGSEFERAWKIIENQS